MKKPIYPQYPITEVTSTGQLMDIATAMEREAAQRFGELAAELERQGNRETSALFRQLAAEECEHEAEIVRWAVREDHYNPVPAEYQWRMPETFDLAETEVSSLTLTPYRALSVAVRNEERAFTFYSYLAALAEDDAVRMRAEALARGELGHVARLRASRRRAFHLERGSVTSPRHRAASLDVLRQIADGLGSGSKQLDELLSSVLESTDDREGAALLKHLSEVACEGLQTHSPRADVTSTSPASGAVETARASGLLAPGAMTLHGALQLMLKDAEEVVQIYLDIAEHARHEVVMDEAQRLAECALSRLAIINTRLNEVDDPSNKS